MDFRCKLVQRQMSASLDLQILNADITKVMLCSVGLIDMKLIKQLCGIPRFMEDRVFMAYCPGSVVSSKSTQK